jgi:hypothetical protein
MTSGPIFPQWMVVLTFAVIIAMFQHRGGRCATSDGLHQTVVVAGTIFWLIACAG